ncbi:phosphoglycolate phosphatase [Pseudomonas saudimassiliensis]|uniref:Phosphoglycolate phosphatase n=1 Tax=Pseudomonas saudimassiliensis TaxID=1461581 RepID=A0A078MG50_9PSED|nr:phosphoglycolate phosphatase [Pseudomonas saudimassiliensis]CEA03631.1 phosphoglycolate phosphatase [Pseudomonas saudimassiliensis]CEF26256.1 phosphoglycolate phosphatase [Pseudomonas saudimassiliensis]
MNALEQLFDGALPRLVMFDLDGTLVDSVPDLAAAVDQVLALRGRPPAGVEQVKDWVGNGALVLVRRALAGSIDHQEVDEAQAQAALADFMQAYSGGHSGTTVYEGVLKLLGWLRERGVSLAVITNKPERFVAPLLEEKGLGEFAWIIGGDTLPVKKPDPTGLLHVMAAAGVTPRQCLFVGDSRNDVLAARAAGVKVVAVSYGYNHGQPIALENPDLLVDSLDALI